MMKAWIWQHPNWSAPKQPLFVWQEERLLSLLHEVRFKQGELLGKAQSSGLNLQTEFSLDAMLQNIIHSSAIEGETLNVESVRSSLARRLGFIASTASTKPEARSEGLAQILFDATQNLSVPLSTTRLLQWHQWLFAGDEGLFTQQLNIGQWRGSAKMQVVSGRIDRPTVHFEAPPRDHLEHEIERFINWFNQQDPRLDPLLRAALAHFWLVTLHPFEDGNGRLTRALTDLALAQGEQQSIRFYAMSAAILADRKNYYAQLEQHQSIDAEQALDLTEWLRWFLQTLLAAITQAKQQINRVLAKSRFWLRFQGAGLTPEQIKVLNRLLDGDQPDRGGFVDGISASQYQAVAKVSKATATRHLTDLLEKGCLVKLAGGGRSTRYQINGETTH